MYVMNSKMDKNEGGFEPVFTSMAENWFWDSFVFVNVFPCDWLIPTVAPAKGVLFAEDGKVRKADREVQFG